MRPGQDEIYDIPRSNLVTGSKLQKDVFFCITLNDITLTLVEKLNISIKKIFLFPHIFHFVV